MSNQKRIMTMALTTLIILGSVLAGCGPTATPEPAESPSTGEEATPTTAPAPPPEEPKTLVIGLDITEVRTLDPQNHFSVLAGFANYQMYDNLVRMTPDNWFEPAPALAESWEWSDDGLALTFYLRPDVKFASGNPFTAEDVRFSLLRHKNFKGSASGLTGVVQDVEVVDDLTARVIFAETQPDFLAVVSTAYVSILDSKLVKEQGGTDAPDAAEVDTATAWLDQNSAGSGPFVLKSWVSDTEIVLEANPNHWRGAPEMDRVVIRNVSDEVATFQMLQRGDIDVFLRPSNELIEEAEADPNIDVLVPNTMLIRHMTFTCDPELSEPLSNPLVWKAIQLALDMDGLLEAVTLGYGNLVPAIIPVGMPGVDPEQAPERDLEAARDLLRQAGYEGGFTETFYYPTKTGYDIIAPKIQSDLAEVGITVNLNPMDSSELSSRVWGEAHDVPWFMNNWVPDYIDYTIWTEWFARAGQGYLTNARCDDDIPTELADATDAIARELDPEKRLQAVEDWQAAIMEWPYTIVVHQQYTPFFLRKGVEGFAYVPAIADLWPVSKE
jgi:peptide/nickel transport system substrate-binding protein